MCVGQGGTQLGADVEGQSCAACVNTQQSDAHAGDDGCGVDGRCVSFSFIPFKDTMIGISNPMLSRAGDVCLPIDAEIPDEVHPHDLRYFFMDRLG